MAPIKPTQMRCDQCNSPARFTVCSDDGPMYETCGRHLAYCVDLLAIREPNVWFKVGSYRNWSDA